MNYAFDWLLNHRWAIMPEVLKTMARISLNSNDKEKELAITAHDGEWLPDTYRVEMHGSVAVIPVIGPIYSLGNYIWRGSSINLIAKDFNSALEDSSVSAIVFNFHTPGGEITGCDDLSNMIYEARGKKPIVSFSCGLFASAGYWFGSAADKVVISKSAEPGSIGIVSIYTDFSKWDEKMGVQEIEIISSQSPKKGLKPTTSDGKAETQRIVDELAEVFINTVARNRGVTYDTVIEKFGQGSVFVGQSAVDAGLADEIGTIESVIAEYNNANVNKSSFTFGGLMNIEELKAKHPDTYNAVFSLGKTAGSEEEKKTSAAAIAAAKSQGAEGERTRIQGIMSLKVPGAETVIAENLFKPEATKETVAVAILENQGKQTQKLKTAMNQDGQELAGAVGNIGNQESPQNDKNAEAAKLGQHIAKLSESIQI